jgi:hypothetical protein
MDINFSRKTERKTRADRIRTKIFGEEDGIQNLLIGIEKKLLQWFGQVKSLDKIKIQRRASELEFKGKRPIE